MGKIEIRNIHKNFGKDLIFEDLSFDIPLNERLAIMGPSGSGKTTLLRILIGLDKDFTGDISGLKDMKKSFVFQEERLIKHLTPIENIKIVNDNLKDEYIKGEMLKVNLADSYYKKVSELSGGMKRRVSLLRGLLYDFDLIFLDEPFKGLDVENRNNVINYINEEYKNKSIILVTHDVHEVELMGIENIIEI